MPNILFCWELGGGLGHAGRLKSLAVPLAARGHRVSLALRDLVLTRRLLSGTGLPVFQAPVFMHRVEGLSPRQASLADILLGCGYLDADALTGLVDGWRALLRATAADLVVGDYAPAAMLAARSMGVRSVAIGTGFALPPAGQALPPLRDWEAPPQARMAVTEARLLDSANRVLAVHGAPPLARACDLLLGDAALPCTWPELDPWRRPAGSVRWFGPNLAPAAGLAPAWPPGAGPRVFAYLGATHPEHGALLAALARAGCRTLCYHPDVAAGKPAPFTHPSLAWAPAPVALDAALAECAFAVCHAGESTVSQALLAGRPLLMLPTTAESFLMARRVRELGAGINMAELGLPADWEGAVRRMLGDASLRQTAQAFAQAHGDYDRAAQAAAVVRELERYT